MKKLLASLILCLGLIPCFSSADTVASLITYDYDVSFNTAVGGTYYTIKQFSQDEYGVYCILTTFDSDYPNSNPSIEFGSSPNTNSFPYNKIILWQSQTPGIVCFNIDLPYFIFTPSYLDIKDINFKFYNYDNFINTNLPVYSSIQCQTEYNLIPISEVDSAYCESNNLCQSGGFPSDCPNVGVSNVFINDIFHPGAFNVIINIPEEIDWDYAYTNSGNNINIDVVGYNQDTEYINSWIDTNNYKPTTDDFSNTFLLFKDYSGLLIALLFVILVFYFVKKLF